MKLLPTFFLVASILSACADTPGNNGKTIEDLVTHFGDQSLPISSKTEKLAPMIGASTGAGLFIEGEAIEIYKFDLDVPDQKTALEKYQKDGIALMTDKKTPVLVNGSFMLITAPTHPRWDEIRAAFASF